jgi:hypothetical protein
MESGSFRQVVAIERQNVERVELRLLVVLARVQRVEVGDAIDAEHYRLAVKDKGFRRALSRIHGYRLAQLKPPRVIRRTRLPSRSSRSRYPSYFTSWSQSGPLGTAPALVGRQN